MFGLGYLEIALIIVILIILFGGRRVGRTLGKTYGTYRKVEETKRKFSLLNLLGFDKSNK